MIRPVDIAALNFPSDHDDVVTYINALMQGENEEKFWFPTPEQPSNEDEQSPIQKRILKQLRELPELEKLDPTESEESRAKLLSVLKWTESQTMGTDRENLEATIVEFNVIFARRRLDIDMNTQFKVSLTPKHDKPVYTQSLPVPINLKRDLTVELALMHRFGIITNFLFPNTPAPSSPNGSPPANLDY